MKLANLYQEINDNGITAIKSYHEQLDQQLITGLPDQRRGLTLLSPLPAHVCRNIEFCLQQVAALEPQQYFYPSADFHITIMDLIAARTSFNLSPATKEQYQQLLAKIMITIGPIQWQLKGFIVSPGALLVKGYYSKNLVKLRTLLRQEIPSAGLPLQERYPTFSGHTTVMRFCQPLQQPQRFLELINRMATVDLGQFTDTTLDLVVHDWYNHNSQLISRISCTAE